MAGKAKDTIERLKKKKAETRKANVTLSIDAAVYKKAKALLEAEKIMISEAVEQFLRELIEKS